MNKDKPKDGGAQNGGTATLQYNQVNVNTSSNVGCQKLRAWANAQGLEVPADILGDLQPPENPVKQIQAVVNRLRKASLKVNRLQAETHSLGQKWEAFQKDLQQQFIREKTKYAADLRKAQEAIVLAKQEEQRFKDQLEQLSAEGHVPVSSATGGVALLDELPGWLTAGPLEPMPVDEWLEEGDTVRSPDLRRPSQGVHVKAEPSSPILPPPGYFGSPGQSGDRCDWASGQGQCRGGPSGRAGDSYAQSHAFVWKASADPYWQCRHGLDFDSHKGDSICFLRSWRPASRCERSILDLSFYEFTSACDRSGCADSAISQDKRVMRKAVKETAKPHGPVLVPTAPKMTLAEKLQAKREQKNSGEAPPPAAAPEVYDLEAHDVPAAEMPLPPSGSDLDLLDG